MLLRLIKKNFYNTETGEVLGYNGEPLKPRDDGYIDVTVNGHTIKAHRLIYEKFIGDIPENMVIDHRNNNPSDNRLENLQLLSRKDNARKINKQKKRTENGEGLPLGVSLVRECYRAYITVMKKKKHLGYFNCPRDAFRCYLHAKIEHHGMYSLEGMLPMIEEWGLDDIAELVRNFMENNTNRKGENYV